MAAEVRVDRSRPTPLRLYCSEAIPEGTDYSDVPDAGASCTQHAPAALVTDAAASFDQRNPGLGPLICQSASELPCCTRHPFVG